MNVFISDLVFKVKSTFGTFQPLIDSVQNQIEREKAALGLSVPEAEVPEAEVPKAEVPEAEAKAKAKAEPKAKAKAVPKPKAKAEAKPMKMDMKNVKSIKCFFGWLVYLRRKNVLV